MPEAATLPGVGDEDRELAGPGRGVLAEPADADDLVPAVLRHVLGDERELAVVVEEADPDEPLVGRALVEAELAEVALVDRLRRERAVELHDERLVLGPDRAEPERGAVARGPVGLVLARVGADRQPRQGLERHVGVVEHDPGVERDEPLG